MMSVAAAKTVTKEERRALLAEISSSSAVAPAKLMSKEERKVALGDLNTAISHNGTSSVPDPVPVPVPVPVVEEEPDPHDEEEEAIDKDVERTLQKTLSRADLGDEEKGQEQSQPTSWPVPLDDHALRASGEWPVLSHCGPEVEQWVRDNKRLMIRAVTWNLCAQKPPPIEQATKFLLPLNNYHIYIIGTEECERSIAASAFNNSKKNWESYLKQALGVLYKPIGQHTLQAIHIIAFAHESIWHLCNNFTSTSVATGLGNFMGNKGAVAISFNVAKTRFAFVNAHLAAHQNATKQRNAEFQRINREAPPRIKPNISSTAGSGSGKPRGSRGMTAEEREKQSAAAAAKTLSSKQAGSDKTSPKGGWSLKGSSSPPLSPGKSGGDSASLREGEGEGEGEGGKQQEDEEAQQQDSNSSKADSSVKVAAIGAGAKETPEEMRSRKSAEAAARSSSSKSHTGSEIKAPKGGWSLRSTSSPPASPSKKGSDAQQLSNVDQSLPKQQEPQQPQVDAKQVEINKAKLNVPGLESCADRVVFMGDLNYRIYGTRQTVDELLARNMYETLANNDQLKTSMNQGLVLNHFTEPPLHFRPTYKLDIDTDTYDTSSKKRIPAWADRILFVQREGLECVAYNSDTTLKTSDHRPVYASFVASIDIDEEDGKNVARGQGASESQVCVLM